MTPRWRALIAAHRRRRLAAGVTLVEVLIVVAIMALIAGGASFLILPKFQEARVRTAKTTARSIRQVTIQYVALKGAGDCPTVQSLIAAKELDSAGDTEDPWGQPYNISCAGDDVTVSSSGPDRKEGTEDDIVVGPATAG
ncbi:MAG TPA: prepilin-type N-terminal cleavage/methylation domain-containing protein [Sorangium sp.]|nr:prepilin-type N-terminal cleavage/methylation domain-containing protein [Sorangium sp.]